ncbi:minor tail protein [Microbacterium phage UtzChips]|nr:minor tail protein [Microbacterium phage UtzChips]
MNVSDLIVEVRDRDLIRRAQLTDGDLDSLVVVPRDNAVGSWQLTLPDTILNEQTGEWEPHAAARALRQEGAGLIVSAPGPDIPPVPPTYAPGRIVRRNLIAHARPTSTSIPTGWSVAGGSTDGDWAVSKTVSSTPYIFAGRAAEAFATGDDVVGTITVQADHPSIEYLRVNVHKRSGNVYFDEPGAQIIVPVSPGVPVEVAVSWTATRDIPTDDLDISVVPCQAGGAFFVPTVGATFRAMRPILERGTTPASYFDGETADSPGPGYAYDWEGTPFASPSVMRELEVIDPGVPAIPTTDTLLSGPMTSATFEAASDDITGHWVFTGVSDSVLLADALAYPQPSNGDPTTQAKANDKRSGSAEALLRQYVAYNIASSHAPDERLTGLRSRLVLDGVSQNRGNSLTKSPRFQNLLELCQEIGFAGGVSFDIAQRGTELVFRVWTPTDRSAFVRMDMSNDLLKSVSYGFGSPSTTVAVVAGQGEGADRAIVSRTSDEATDAETRWGRRIERFVDQRNTEVTAELEQKGDETILEGGATATGLQATPTDTDTMLLLRDWNVGDIVAVVIEGQEVKAPVSEVALGVTGAAVTLVATLGEASAFDTDAASQKRAQETSSRVSAIERTLEVPTAYSLDDIGGSLPLSRTSGTLPTSRLTGDLPIDRTTGDLPLSRTTGDLPLGRTSGLLPPSRIEGGIPDPTWANLEGKPSTFPPSSHSHSWGQITGKPESVTGSVTPYGGWAAYGGLEPRYTIQPDGTVILSGLIRRTASAFTASARSTYEFGLLTPSIRPARAKYLPINTSIGLTEGIVQANGVLMFRPFSNMSVGVGTFFSLDGIVYNIHH